MRPSNLRLCQPDDLLTGEELVAVDEDAGDVAEEKDEDDADEDGSEVDLLLRRGSRPHMGHSERLSIKCERNDMGATGYKWDNYHLPF